MTLDIGPVLEWQVRAVSRREGARTAGTAIMNGRSLETELGRAWSWCGWVWGYVQATRRQERRSVWWSRTRCAHSVDCSPFEAHPPINRHDATPRGQFPGYPRPSFSRHSSWATVLRRLPLTRLSELLSCSCQTTIFVT